jgi:hypothetical protein
MARYLVLLVLAVAISAPVSAQSIGAILSGLVTDESGARLQGVVITITNASNGRSQTLVSGDEGEYRVVALQPAPYHIAAERDGFAPFAREVTLTVGADARLDIRLSVSGVRENVVVAPSPLSIEVARHEPSSVVTEDQIRALPEIGRNFLVLAQLLPGSAPLNASVTRFATTKFGGVADQRSSFTTLIDGGDVDDAQWGSPTINLSQESVQEFKVFRNQFDAQYGQALNAVVSVVTRSGSNQLRGSGFYFGRDAALNARNAFAPTKPPFDEQRFGATVGGPLSRNRTHFFGTYEYDHVDTARIIAHPPTSRFVTENGLFPATSNDRLALFKLDHRLSARHNTMIRYAYANQAVERLLPFPTSDSSQVDTFSRAHSVVAEDDWVVSARAANTLRVHWFSHTSGGAPHGGFRGAAEQRLTIQLGLVNGGEWVTYPRTEVAIADTLFLSAAKHDLKLGGEFGFGTNELDSHFFQDGLFFFQTDVPFNPADSRTWPVRFVQQAPGVETYRSRQFAVFVQDDWRAAERLRVNLGLRYDLEPTLRLNDFYARALADPSLAGLGAFITADRGTDSNNLQPRLGATYDLRGDATLVVRGGWGMYVARNRPWFQVRAMNQIGGRAIQVEDSSRLQLYPDVSVVVAGGGPRQLGTVIADDFVQSYALNTTAGVGWQLRQRATLDVDYVHSYGAKQYGTTDRNLPATGPVTLSNPRPVPQFAQVAMLENFTSSWYDALESQFRMRFGDAEQLQVSYTLSRSYLDGVDFFVNQRGTQRTPRERGYSPSDQRHNLSAAATFGLPAGLHLSAIVKLISGSPMPVQAGFDLDGDRSPGGDRPDGVPITVGRGDTVEQRRLIDAFRAGLATPLSPVAPALLKLDPYRTLDLRLTKTLSVGGAGRLELLIEAFNVTNFVNYFSTVVNRFMNSDQFLRRTGARDARQVQWGTRLTW